jgi:hypothetical protein
VASNDLLPDGLAQGGELLACSSTADAHAPVTFHQNDGSFTTLTNYFSVEQLGHNRTFIERWNYLVATLRPVGGRLLFSHISFVGDLSTWFSPTIVYGPYPNRRSVHLGASWK